MGLSDFVALGCLAFAVAFVGFGLAGLRRAIRAERQRRAWADYRAACMVVTERDKLRAAQRRAAELAWRGTA